MDINRTIGDNIRTYRKHANMTQKELAQKCGFATGTIQQYEFAKRQPRYEQLCAISKALDITPSKLIFNSNDGQYLDNDLQYFDYKGSVLDNILKIIEQYNPSVDIEGAIKASLNYNEKYLHELKELYDDYSVDFKTHKLINLFWELNEKGKKEAIKRIEELTEIKKYTEPDTPPEPDQEPDANKPDT